MTMDNLFAWCFGVYMACLFAVTYPSFAPEHSSYLQQRQSAGVIASQLMDELTNTIYGMPRVLNKKEANLYQEIFAAQEDDDWEKADRLLSAIRNPILKGDVLAARFLHHSYDTSEEELKNWLAQYRDLPVAYDIYLLSQRKFGLKTAPVAKLAKMSITGNENIHATSFKNSPYYHTWKKAIQSYQLRQYTQAANLFDSILVNRQQLSSWNLSAAGFWAWRTHQKTGNEKKAWAALHIAAMEPRSFYGILARKQLGMQLNLTRSKPSLSEEEIENLTRYKAVKRATALMQINQRDRAERELSYLHPRMPQEEQHLALQLANLFSRPVAPISLAKKIDRPSLSYDLAKYPVPDWQPAGGFDIDPALIYALVRQESGFKQMAISPAGAMGLMQLMPATASMMSKKIGAESIAGLSPAEQNVTLGQSYIKHLLKNQLVEENIVFMLAAYNAGIGRLQQWKQNIDYQDDPLLFIEYIPFGETRHYVMQVLTNYWVYNEILGTKSPSLAALAKDEWPRYALAQDIS